MPLSTGRSILCVDDDPVVLNILKRALESDYLVHTANSAEAGLSLIASTDSIQVVISDHRMPKESGAQFLRRVRDLKPAIARVLLTGEKDLSEAVAAMNQASLFRFLLKPGTREVLLDTIRAATAHHDLQVAERELLQKTLIGTMSALGDVLAIANPIAFGRVNRLQELSVLMGKRLELSVLWPLEFASLASQLGHIALPDRVVRRIHTGEPLTGEEQSQVSQAHLLAHKILKNIPRLGPVLEILESLSTFTVDCGGMEAPTLPADILRVASAYTAAEHATESREGALHRLRASSDKFNPQALRALTEVLGIDLNDDAAVEIPIEHVRVGMVVAEDVITRKGALMVPRGYRISEGFVAKLGNFKADALPKTVRVKKNSG